MKEQWKPLLETDDENIYQKGNKTLLISKRGITLQTNTEIFKRKRPMKEFEPIKENKLPICAGCKQGINVNDPEIVYLRYKDKDYHEDCLRLNESKENKKDRTPEEIIFREAPLGEQTDVDLKEHIVFDSNKAINKKLMANTKKGSPWYYARNLYLQKKEERRKMEGEKKK